MLLWKSFSTLHEIPAASAESQGSKLDLRKTETSSSGDVETVSNVSPYRYHWQCLLESEKHSVFTGGVLNNPSACGRISAAASF